MLVCFNQTFAGTCKFWGQSEKQVQVFIISTSSGFYRPMIHVFNLTLQLHFTILLSILKWVLTGLFTDLFYRNNFVGNYLSLASHMTPEMSGPWAVELHTLWSKNWKIFMQRCHNSNREDEWVQPEHNP